MRSIRTAFVMTALIAIAPTILAQKKSTAENRLVGIKLYDTGLRVVQVYGTPDEIQPVTFGGGAVGPAGGGRGPGGGGFGAPAGGAGGGASPGSALGMAPDYSFENDILLRAQKGGLGEGGARGRQGGGLTPAPGGGGGPTPGPSGGGGGGMRSDGLVKFTRWIYKRSGSRYSFIMDNKTRVVQIEAIGLQNRSVRTRKGIGFGNTFADVIKKYQRPEAYDINGEQIVVRFLSQNKVAFRLSRLGPDKPHVVTGVVVAAGKG